MMNDSYAREFVNFDCTVLAISNSLVNFCSDHVNIIE